MSNLNKRKVEDDLSDAEESEEYDLKRIKAEPEVMLGAAGLDESAEDFEEGAAGNGDETEFENFTQFGDEEGFDESIEEISRAPGVDGESKGNIFAKSFSQP